MKKIFYLIIAATVFLWIGSASAVTLDPSTLGSNITIFDGVSSNDPSASGPGHLDYGYEEDGEVEPGTNTGSQWDLEAFFLGGYNLSVLGQFNFQYGQQGNDQREYFGDIFVDINKDAVYGEANEDSEHVETNLYGYDYVFDITFGDKWNEISYDVVRLDEGSTVELVNQDLTVAANPYKYADGGTVVGSGFASISFYDYALGFNGNNDSSSNWGHYVLSGFDTKLILDDFGGNSFEKFLFHATLSCGNDNLMGDPVPEPGTFALLGLGLLGMAFWRRKKV